MHCDRAGAKIWMKSGAALFKPQVLLRIAGVTVVALIVSNCSSNVRGGVDSKYGVAPSPRVVADGRPIPKGGGRRMIGKPYTIAGRTYVPTETPRTSEGIASWYGSDFHGRMTANGEIFDRNSIAAAHTTMPLPSYARVTNLQNGHSIIVRVNDRGPFHGNRVIDVSERAAMALGFRRQGTARVRVDYVGRASTNGSDDRILLASLRTDGQPALLNNTAPTMIAGTMPKPSETRQPTGVPSYGNERRIAAASPFEARQAGATSRPAAIPVASNVPLPPERPFDLGTIPGAATPITLGAAASGIRPAVAGLSYATPASRSGFYKNTSFDHLDQSKFVLR